LDINATEDLVALIFMVKELFHYLLVCPVSIKLDSIHRVVFLQVKQLLVTSHILYALYMVKNVVSKNTCQIFNCCCL